MGLTHTLTHTHTDTVTLTLCRLITVIAHTVFPALCLRVFQFFSFFSFFSVFRFRNRARRRLQLRSWPGHGARARKKRIKKAQTDCRWSAAKASEESTGSTGSTESWSNYKTGSSCSCSRVSLCTREREIASLLGCWSERAAAMGWLAIPGMKTPLG